MTYDLDPQLPEEQTYEAPKEFVHELREDGSEPGVVGHLNPVEVPIFHRIRDEQMRKHGAVHVRNKGMAWMLKAAEEARVEAHG